MSEHTAFSEAIEAGDVEAVEALIRQYPELVDKYDDLPSRADYAEVVELLQQFGVE